MLAFKIVMSQNVVWALDSCKGVNSFQQGTVSSSPDKVSAVMQQA